MFEAEFKQVRFSILRECIMFSLAKLPKLCSYGLPVTTPFHLVCRWDNARPSFSLPFVDATALSIFV